MKKLALALAVTSLFAAGDLFAQYTPGKGNVSLEVQFNPFDQNGNTFKLDGLKFRYFINEKNALRLKLGFETEHSDYSVKEEKEKKTEGYKYSYVNEIESTTGTFSFEIGYERHFNLAKRLNIYVGAIFGSDRHFASTDFSGKYLREYNRGDIYGAFYNGEIINGADVTAGKESDNILPEVKDRAFWGINAAIITGLDFYVYKRLYVGAELGLKVHSLKYSKMEFEYEIISDRKNIEEDYETDDNKRLTSCGIYIEPVLRLGWTF